MLVIPEPDHTVLALHGFTLGGAMFDELEALLSCKLIAPDLPGHGGRDADNTKWHEAVAEIITLATQLKPALVLGYSMGGRLALGAALDRPDLIDRLVLASASFGIAEASERTLRQRSDEALARRLEDGGVDNFVEAWTENPMLASSPHLDALRIANRSAGLAGALRGMGQGSQPYLGDRLAELAPATTWIAGSEDAKYASLARHAAGCSPRSSVKVIADARHNVIQDAPRKVARIVNRLLAE